MDRIRGTGLGDKRRLIAVLAALLVVGFGGASVFAFMAARDAIRATIEENGLPVAAETVYTRLQADLMRPLLVSSMMADDTFLHAWVEEGEGEVGEIAEYLGEIKARYGAFAAFFVSDRTLRYYYPDGVLKVVRPDEPRDAWYWRVRSMTMPYELNVDPDLANDDTLTVFINYRVVDSDGRYLGAAGIGISVDALTEMVDRLRDAYGTALYFVDEDGQVVAGMPAGLGTAPATLDDDPALSALAASALADGSHRYARNGEEILLHVRWVPELSWFLFVERPEGAAVAGARRALYVNLAVLALILVLVLLTATLTVNRFQSRLERTASTDQLTGIMNRTAFGIAADHAVKEARRSGRPLAAAMFDVDGFKRVNDALGHPAGDATLRAVALAIGTGLRESDLLCRWGREEFLVLFVSCALDDAAAVVEKVRAAVADRTGRDGLSRVTVSAGLAAMTPGEAFESLVRRADEALLAAKRAGKDRSVAAG